MKEKTDKLKEKIEKDYKNMMAVINSTSLPLFVEDTIEDMHILITTLISENKELKEEIEELKRDKLELINKNHVVHLKDVEKELREMRKVIDTKNAEIECLNVIHESYKEMIEENNFISKDKIKAKIEEVEQWGLYNMKIPKLSTLDERLGAKIGIKYVLQSLLGKE